MFTGVYSLFALSYITAKKAFFLVGEFPVQFTLASDYNWIQIVEENSCKLIT